jgi:hypothetical protein
MQKVLGTSKGNPTLVVSGGRSLVGLAYGLGHCIVAADPSGGNATIVAGKSGRE